MTEPRRRIYMKLHWSHTLLGVMLLGIPSGLLLHSYSSLLRNQSFQETHNSAADLARRVERGSRVAFAVQHTGQHGSFISG